MNNAIEDRKYIYGHTSPETAYVVECYPWGFRLRTTIRYWIETKDTKNGGQRFASQTINPKTCLWCKPKYSTYSPIMFMYLDEKNHVQYETVEHFAQVEYFETVMNRHMEFLSDYQKNKFKYLFALNKVMSKVKWEFVPVPLGEERKDNEEKTLNQINRALAYELNK